MPLLNLSPQSHETSRLGGRRKSLQGLLRFYYVAASVEGRIFWPIRANRYKINALAYDGLVAQRLEQRTHNSGCPFDSC